LEKGASRAKPPSWKVRIMGVDPPLDTSQWADVGRLIPAYSAKAAASYQLTPETG
jgi:hypothetical protein